MGGLVEQLGGRPGALLCEPEAESLAEAIRTLLAQPPDFTPPADASAAWNEMAATLVQQLVPVIRGRHAPTLADLSPSARAP